MIKKRHFDYALFFITFGLLAFGLMMIYSTSAYEASREFDGDAAHYFKRQLLSTLIGLAAMYGVSKIPYQWYKDHCPWWLPLAVAVGSMMMLLTPWAHTANGATRWFYLFGSSALSIQPAEIVKMMMIIFGAKMVAEKPSMMQTWKGFGVIVGPAVLLGVVVRGLSNNLSSALIVMGIGVVIIFIASPQYKKYVVAATALVVVVAAAVVWLNRSVDTADMGNYEFRGQRIVAWLHPELYSDGVGYQTLQSLYAIGSGGVTGKGIGESVQKMGFIPEAQNDMIFAIICEELGLVGAFLVIILFAVLIFRLNHIALHARDLHGAMLAVGVMAHISIQVILNIAVVTNLIPNTGISLPFISYGGSAVIFTLMELGIVLNVARTADL